jgi:hypothetical protein
MVAAVVRRLVGGTVALLLTSSPALAAPPVLHGQIAQWRQICLDASDAFQPLGTFNFTLPQSAGYRTIFAQTHERTITAMIVVQEEHMLAPSDSYRYPLQPGVSVGAVPFRVNVFAESNALGALQAPHAETALTAQYLAKREFRVADQWLAVRYATYDSSGKNEFLVFYMEPLDTDTLDLSMVGPGDLPAFTSAFAGIRARADAAVKLRACASAPGSGA